MKELRTEIEINASAKKIWAILMDFDKYPEWNPFVISILGKPKLRERLKVTLQPPQSKAMVMKPQITLLKKEKQFGWLGSLFMRGIFDGHHIFEIEETPKGTCKFIHREEFSGFLVPAFWKKLDTQVRAGFISMNKKIKELAEQ